MREGWISLYRSIQDCWLWKEKPFDRARAWIDLLLLANHEDNKVLIGNELILVKRGEMITSIRKLCERWGWSNTKVKNFLNLIQNENMIAYFSDTKKTTISIVKYSVYQTLNDTKNISKTTRKRRENITKTSRKHTNNNDNNDNNDNNIYNNNKEHVQVVKNNALKTYQNNIYPVPGAIEIESIMDWVNRLSDEIVSYAITIAAKNNAKNFKYIEHILMDWERHNIKSLEQAKLYSENRTSKGDVRNGNTKQTFRQNKNQANRTGKGEELAQRAITKYADRFDNFKCDF